MSVDRRYRTEQSRAEQNTTSICNSRKGTFKQIPNYREWDTRNIDGPRLRYNRPVVQDNGKASVAYSQWYFPRIWITQHTPWQLPSVPRETGSSPNGVSWKPPSAATQQGFLGCQAHKLRKKPSGCNDKIKVIPWYRSCEKMNCTVLIRGVWLWLNDELDAQLRYTIRLLL